MPGGSIEPLPSGRFRAVVRAGSDPITGKPFKLTETCATELLAAQARDRLLAQVEAESHPDRAATLSTLLDRWSDVADHSLNTQATNEVYIRRVLRPALGDTQLRKLQHRVDILDRLYKHMQRCSSVCDGKPFVEHKTAAAHRCEILKCQPHACRPASPSTVRRVHAILSSSLGYAVSWGWIERNPAEYAHPPKLKRRRARPPQDEQVARLLNLAWETDVELAMFLWLATTLGARRGELTSLRWTAIDLRKAVVTIDTSYVVRSGQRQLKETKTDTDRRVSLDTLTVQMLTEFRDQRREALAPAHLELADDAFLFSPDPACLRPWHPDHFTHAYRQLADVLDIAEPLKNLRHFNATQLLASGVDLRTVAGRLGHTDGGATTLKVYADSLPATDRKAAEHLATDLVALRRTAAKGQGTSLTSPTAGPRRSPRPVSDYLAPPADGRMTSARIAGHLRVAIEAGDLQSGDAFPTVTELAIHYAVARSTAHRALTAISDLTCKIGARHLVVR